MIKWTMSRRQWRGERKTVFEKQVATERNREVAEQMAKERESERARSAEGN